MASATSPPSLPGNWLTGHVSQCRRDLLGFFARCAKEQGDVVSFRLGRRRLTLLSHPDFIEQVLVQRNRDFQKHYAMRLLSPVLGDGLLLSEDELWLRQRRLMQPAFGPRQIEAYARAMIDHTVRMLDGWQDGQTLDLHHTTTELTLAIAAKVLLDVDAGEQAAQVGRSMDVLMEDFNLRFRSAWPRPHWLPTPWNFRVWKAIASLNGLITDIIHQRRSSGEYGGDLLSLLIRARDEDDAQGMTDRQLRDEVMTIFLAGHETTANALSWTWYLLARHPEVEERLLAEMDNVLGGRPVEPGDFDRLRYTQQVVQESMRLYPPAYVVGRQARRPCEFGGYRFSPGATLLMSQWVVHRDERWFPDPLRFQPERWSESFTASLPKYAYFPFGGGPRVCIGNKFALVEATLILAAAVPRFRVALLDDRPIDPWPAITLRPQGGVPVRVSRRN